MDSEDEGASEELLLGLEELEELLGLDELEELLGLEELEEELLGLEELEEELLGLEDCEPVELEDSPLLGPGSSEISVPGP